MADSSDSISTKSAININENKMIETLAKNNEQKWQNLGFDSDSTKRILRKNSTKPDLFNKEISDKQNKTKIRTIRSFSNIEFIMNLSNFSEEDKTFLKFGIISNKLTTNNNSNDSNSKQEKSTGNGTSNESNHSNDTSKKSSSENNTSNNSSSENDPSEISNETNTINNTENSNNETSTSNDTFCTELDHRSQIMTPNQEKRRQRKSKIPERLIPLIKCPPESPTYHALCEEPLGKIDQEKMNETLTELHQLVEEAANNGYIEEAKYVQDVEASIRCDKLTTARYSVESALEEIETKLSEAKNEYEEQMKQFVSDFFIH
ncbi:hypothetical protein TRFO_29345 [Tritrichomonas foetus]|uniref:Uncharacterized protein n=1 Tax=Tritrichomonas foetus TaxID=1144522 RepID=A0A1J4K1E9_9EUKA|nr:hypothetical protein TRFO_29345 [Tritrichomonas foetus]|eukprot:OHT03301.1 hypothetical protein TRFO_29345 [Tritrichomonas foetus]